MKFFIGFSCVLLMGCAQTPELSSNDVHQQLQLRALIAKVAKEQAVTDELPATPSVLFESSFDENTRSLLGSPSLMPALMSAAATQLELVVGVQGSHEHYQAFAQALRLSAELQQFLQQQNFEVRRRFDPKASRNLVQIHVLQER